MPKKVNKLEKFSDDELYADLIRRQLDKEVVHYKTLSVSGFTGKDVVCMQGGAYDEPDDEYGPQYHFYLKVDGKLFDIYYMNCCTDPYRHGSQEAEPSRWPKDFDCDENVALSLVPPGFAEASENSYEYNNEKRGDIKKHLAKYGITDYRVWDPKLVDGDHDKNYDV